MPNPIGTQSVLARTLEVQRVQEAYQQGLVNQQHEFAVKLQQVIRQRQIQVQHPERPEHEPIQTQEHGRHNRRRDSENRYYRSSSRFETEAEEHMGFIDPEHHILDVKV